MTGPLRTLGVALALGLLAALTAPSGSRATRPAGATTAPLGGVNISSLEFRSELADADRDMAQARRLHAKLARTTTKWSVLEPLGPNRLDLHALAFVDRLVADAAAAGIRVIMTVEGTPCWASAAPAQLLARCQRTRDSDANRWPPKDPGRYAEFVGFLARRYGDRLAAIEIWNEPDHVNQRFFAGPEKAVRYAAILKAAYPAIKRANPHVPVLAGSLVGSNGVFLRSLYAAGIKGYYDGLAVHYYTLVLAALRSIHQVQLENADSAPLWLDEFGWSSCYPRQRIQQEQPCVTPAIQATNVANVLHSLARTPYVAASVLYDLQDDAREQFGVLASRGARKPAFAALSRALAAAPVDASPISLSLRARGGITIARGSAPVGDIMQMEVFRGSLLRYRVPFTLDRFNRFSFALPAVLGTHGLTVRVFQRWSGPGRDAQATI